MLAQTAIKESLTGKTFPALGTEKEVGWLLDGIFQKNTEFCWNIPEGLWYGYSQIKSKDNP